MGSGASTQGYVESTEAICSLNENEGVLDLQLATTNVLRTHMLRLSQLGKLFSLVCKEGETSMMADEFIKRVKRDPITRMFTGMPAKYSASGNLVTFGDVYKQILEQEKAEPVSWISLIKYFRMPTNSSEEGIKHIKSVFDMLDQNSDGKVSKAEFLASLQNDKNVAAILGLPAILEEDQENNSMKIKSFIDIFEQIDKDADLEVDWQEFLNFFVYESKNEDTANEIKNAVTSDSETVTTSSGTNEDTVTVKDDNIATGDIVAEGGTENPELAEIIPVQAGPNPVEET